MLIGFDWLGLPPVAEDNRGVGRYARRLLAAFEGRDADRPTVYAPIGSAETGRPGVVAIADEPWDRLTRTARQRLVDGNPAGLDWLVLVDPLAATPFGGPPCHGLSSSFRLAAVLPEWPGRAGASDASRRALRSLENLARFDLIFTPTEALAEIVRARLSMPADRVVSLGPLCDRDAFRPCPEPQASRLTREFLCARNIRSSYILHEPTDAGSLREVLDAYTRLPIGIRHRYALVVAASSGLVLEAESIAFDLGISEGVTLLSDLEPVDRARLIQAASLLVAAGRRERLDQPEFEAAACGVPILADSTAGRREWLGEAAAWIERVGPEEMAEAIGALLDFPEARRFLSEEAIRRTAMFKDEAATTRFRHALERTPARSGLARVIETIGLRPRPRLACLPADGRPDGLPPTSIERTLATLHAEFAVDLFVESHSRLFDLPMPGPLGCFGLREFDRRDSVAAYEGIVYEIGEATDLDRQLERIRERPGVVLVRDRAWMPPASFATLPPDRLKRSATLDPSAPACWVESLARRILGTGSVLALASQWAHDRVRPFVGEDDSRLAILPCGPEAGDWVECRAASRARLEMSEDELLVIHCGPSADDDAGMIRAMVIPREAAVAGATGAGISRSILARTREDWLQLAAGADLAIHPGDGPSRPERGLALLDLLRAGLPVIVPECGLPAGVVFPLCRPADLGIFAAAVRTLADDPTRRRTIGESARRYANDSIPTAEFAARLRTAVELVAARSGDARQARRRWRDSAGHEFAGIHRPVATTWAEGRSR